MVVDLSWDAGSFRHLASERKGHAELLAAYVICSSGDLSLGTFGACSPCPVA